jgi:hypothetical protein
MYNIFNKTVITLVIIFLIVGVIAILFALDFSKDNTVWGVTFSPYYAQDELGLDWKQTYTAILDDLNVDHIRLSSYWNHIEPNKDIYNFEDLDWQINEATKRNVNITLAVGRRLPRWPECHDPKWIKNLNPTELEAQQLEFIEKVANRYKLNENIKTWQVENEPFLGTFGECPPLDKNLLIKEVNLIKEITKKPILVTDSGELSTWVKAAKTESNILGTTLYRTVYSSQFGYIHYPLPPLFYAFKSWWIRTLFKTDKIIIAELQTESWHDNDSTLESMTQLDHDKSLSIKRMSDNINYAEKTGMPEVYLWGVEWWYFMKEKKDQDNYWNIAKELWIE